MVIRTLATAKKEAINASEVETNRNHVRFRRKTAISGGPDEILGIGPVAARGRSSIAEMAWVLW